MKCNVFRVSFQFLVLLLLIGCTNNDRVQVVNDKKNSEPKQTKIVGPMLEGQAQEESEEVNPIGKGRITTLVDGVDVQRVNLFSSTNSSRRQICALKNGEKVDVLRVEEPYFFIKSKSDNSCQGYCMKEFVILE
ncbi:hypothetical protein [Owenweeksia hongkongensis]|uniref:hypothetical protein n=1 Tax=Owenweeksia hongkongensis TaxID=253245 RepID=UPI003A8F60B2